MNSDLVDLAQVVSAGAVVIQSALLIVGLLYAVGQVREARKGRSADVVLHLFDRLHNREASEMRRRLYQEIAPAFPNTTAEQERVMQDVISDFYQVGYLVETGLLDFGMVADLYYGTVARCWTATEAYIMRERERRGTLYAHYFERLYERCVAHQEKKYPGSKPLTFLGPSAVPAPGQEPAGQASAVVPDDEHMPTDPPPVPG